MELEQEQELELEQEQEREQNPMSNLIYVAPHIWRAKDKKRMLETHRENVRLIESFLAKGEIFFGGNWTGDWNENGGNYATDQKGTEDQKRNDKRVWREER